MNKQCNALNPYGQQCKLEEGHNSYHTYFEKGKATYKWTVDYRSHIESKLKVK